MTRAAAPRRSAAPPTPMPSSRRGRAAYNALSHGLRSYKPIIPGVETADDWLLHHQGVLEELAPVGHIEKLLSDRIALGFWRLMRVTRYETLLVTYSDKDSHPSGPGDSVSESDADDSADDDDEDGDEDGDDASDDNKWAEIEAVVPQHARDTLDRFDAVLCAADSAPIAAEDALAVIDVIRGQLCQVPLSAFAVPGIKDVPLTECHAWTAGLVRLTIHAICERFEKDPAVELRRTLEALRDLTVQPRRAPVPSPLSSRPPLSPLATHPLPPAHLLDRLVRYEAHLTRDVRQWLADLERWQARRLARHAADPPADVPAAESVSAKRNGLSREKP